ncbi:MAG: dienelactone hydrolase family protein [Taibaiella sp.]|nr:dienelactone hydrolase family protein [Taibaiella sp.]
MKNLILIVAAIACFGLGASAQLQTDLSLKYLVQQPGKASAHPPVIILLHGYGSNEEDLFGLRVALPANYLIASVRAPLKADVGGYQWFEREIVNGKYTGKKEHLDQSRKTILKFIGEFTKKYRADPSSVYLAGFSQGAMMSYEAGLTSPANIKGIAVLSGKMPESLIPLINTKDPALKRLRIFISHGTADSRLPFSDGFAAKEQLVKMGFTPEFHSYQGMDHSITNEVMTDLLKWLK